MRVLKTPKPRMDNYPAMTCYGESGCKDLFLWLIASPRKYRVHGAGAMTYLGEIAYDKHMKDWVKNCPQVLLEMEHERKRML